MSSAHTARPWFDELELLRQRVYELEARDECWRMLADAAPVMLWMAGPDALFTYVNQPWLSFTGRSLDQELGRGWAESIHPAESDHSLTVYMTAFEARESFRMEYRLPRADGEYRWMLNTGV